MSADDSGIHTLGPGCMIVVSLFGVLAVVVVAARLWARQVLQKGNIDIDDWIIIVAMPFLIAQLVISIVLTDVTGFNRHIWDVNVPQRITMEKFYTAQELLYVVSSNLIKISVLFFYRRFATAEINRMFLWAIWNTVALESAGMIAAVILLVTICSPISSIWYQHDPAWTATHTYSCLPSGFLWPFASAVSAVQDFATTLIPLPIVWRMTTCNSWQKAGMVMMFSGGFFLSMLGIVRSWLVSKMFLGEKDESWYGYYYVTLAVVEVAGGVIFCSLPALKAYTSKARDLRLNFFGLKRRHRSEAEDEAIYARQTGLTGYTASGTCASCLGGFLADSTFSKDYTFDDAASLKLAAWKDSVVSIPS